VIPVGTGVDYAVRVTDLHTGELMATAKFTDGNTGDSVVEYKDVKVRIHLQPTYSGIAASMMIEKGSVVTDSMDARWSTLPIGVTLSGATGPPFTNALRVGGEVKAPVIVSRIEPIYSEEARRAHISGIVILEALIDKNGNVTDVNVLKPLPFGLDQAAVDAVKQWKFKPGTKNGEAVDGAVNLTGKFKLDTEGPPPPPPAQ